MAKERNQQGGHQGDQDRAYPPDNLPNPTMNASLTDPGPPPAEAAGSAASAASTQSSPAGTGGGAGSGAHVPNPPGHLQPPPNLPELKADVHQASAGQGSTQAPPRQAAHLGQTMASTRSATNAGDQGDAGLIPEIPWDPTGKIDDEVERRTLGSPKCGGQNPRAGGAGPGRYGGESDETVSPNRYAGASDDAPTSPAAGATTTLASLTAEESDHEMRQGVGSSRQDDSETWQGGQATQEAMHADDEFGNQSAHQANTPDWQVSSGSNTPGEHPRVEQYGGGGGNSEVF